MDVLDAGYKLIGLKSVVSVKLLVSGLIKGFEPSFQEVGILLPNNQRQHRTLHVPKDVLPYALC